MTEKTIAFDDVQMGDEIAITGCRVLVIHVEPDPEKEDHVVIHYRGKDGMQQRVTRHVTLTTTLYARPADEVDHAFLWRDVRVGHTVLVLAHGNVVITKIEDPADGVRQGKVYSFVDSDGEPRTIFRDGHHTTDRTIVPGEVIADDPEDGEKVEGETPPKSELEAVIAGQLTAKYLEHPVTLRYDATLGFDTTIHAAKLVGYSVNLENVRLYLENDKDLHVPVNVAYDQILCIHPSEIVEEK